MIQWSYSSLKDFINCPKQYYEVKVAKSVTKKVTDNMLYGTEVHKAIEDYVREGKPLAKHYSHYKPVLDELLSIPGNKYPEFQMGLKRDLTKCEFDAEDRWVRGIVDLLIVDGEDAFIIDFKTGNNKYPDPKQLRLMALMTSVARSAAPLGLRVGARREGATISPASIDASWSVIWRALRPKYF